MKYLKWIDSRMSEIMLMALYLFSVTPIFLKPHGILHYAFIGAIFGISAYVMIDRNKKMANFSLHFWLVMGILVLGSTGFCLLHGIKSGAPLTIAQQSLSCYVGALGGIIFAGALEGFVQGQKKDENEKKG